MNVFLESLQVRPARDAVRVSGHNRPRFQRECCTGCGLSLPGLIEGPLRECCQLALFLIVGEGDWTATLEGSGMIISVLNLVSE